MKETATKTISIRVRPSEYEKLKKVADLEGIGLATVLRRSFSVYRSDQEARLDRLAEELKKRLVA